MNPNNKKTLIATGLLALVFGLGSLVITPTSESNQQANIFQSIKNIFTDKKIITSNQSQLKGGGGAQVPGWNLTPFGGVSGNWPDLSFGGEHMVVAGNALIYYDTSIIDPYGENYNFLANGEGHNLNSGSGRHHPSISADGRYVAFDSYNSNLVSQDSNDSWDIFVEDRETGVIELVSVSSGGVQGGDDSRRPSISADGRYVAFISKASNLIPEDISDEVWDLYVYDRDNQTIKKIAPINDNESIFVILSLPSAHPSISADGRYISFTSNSSLLPEDLNEFPDIYVYDRESEEMEIISISSEGVLANFWSSESSISADGRYVAFVSLASNIDTEDSDYQRDVFIHDRDTGVTKLVSSSVIENDGDSFGPSISADGRYVAFQSLSTSLVSGDVDDELNGVYLYDQETEIIQLLSADIQGGVGTESSYSPVISPNGQYVAFVSSSVNFPPYNTNVSRVFLVKLWEDYCPQDINGDGVVGSGDLIALFQVFGTICENCPQDINGDGVVGSGDLITLLQYLGQSCPIEEEYLTKPEINMFAEITEPQTLESIGMQYNTILTFTNTTKQTQSNQTIPLSVDFMKYIQNSTANKQGVSLDEKRGTITIPQIKSGEQITIYLDVALDREGCAKLSRLRSSLPKSWCK